LGGSITYVQELILLHSLGDFQKSVDLIIKIEELELFYGEKINKEQEILLTYQKSYSYFGLGEFKKALFYLNVLLNDNEQNFRQDIYSFLRLFNIILHFEIGNYDYLDYVIKSTSRFLDKQDRSFEAENTFINYIKKIAKAVSSKDKMNLFVELKNELDSLLIKQNEDVLLEFFNITAWIGSKINDVSFYQSIENESIAS